MAIVSLFNSSMINNGYGQLPASIYHPEFSSESAYGAVFTEIQTEGQDGRDCVMQPVTSNQKRSPTRNRNANKIIKTKVIF